MREALRNIREAAHYWANQTQPRGRAGNVSFAGGVLFSYRTAIGQHVINKRGERAVLVNDTSYSNSTSKQQSVMCSALPGHLRKIYIHAYVDRGTQDLSPRFETTVPLWMRESINYQVAALLVKASKARKNADQYRADAHNLLQSVKEYAEFFDLEYTAPDNLDELQAAAVADDQRRKIEAEQRKQARLQEQAERLLAWRNGADIGWTNFEQTALRISADGSEIETSRGARIPVDHARRVWSLLTKWKADGTQYQRGDKSIALGHYTVQQFNGNELTVGCHVIPWDEIAAIAVQLGLN